MKSLVPELKSTSAFYPADLKAMQDAFEKSCREMGLGPDRPDPTLALLSPTRSSQPIGMEYETDSF